MSALSALPPEILTNIFIHIDVPTAFVCTSKAFKRIGRDHVNMVKWIEHRYYRNERIFYNLYCIYDCPWKVLKLLSMRAATCSNRFLSQIECKIMTCLTHDHYHRIKHPTKKDGKSRFYRASTSLAFAMTVTPKRFRNGEYGGEGINWLALYSAEDSQKMAASVGLLPMNYMDANGWPIEPVMVVARHDREAVRTFLLNRGLPAYTRESAIDLALAILLKNNDIDWWFASLKEVTGFPSLQDWSFIQPVLAICLHQSRAFASRLFMDQAGTYFPLETRLALCDPGIKFLLNETGASFYRYGYIILDSHRRAGTANCQYNAFQLRYFMQQGDRRLEFPQLIVHLLRSYRGERLYAESERFQTGYLTYVANTARVTTFPSQVNAAPNYSYPDQSGLAIPFRKIALFVKHKAELDAFWLVLKITDKLMPGMDKDISFLRARVSYESILHLLAYPWLSSRDITMALQLAALYLPKNVDLVALVEAAVERVLGNAFCGSHLLELASRLRDAGSLIEARVSRETVDAILVYLDLDDTYTEDPVITGLQQYRAGLAVEHPKYSNMGPDTHLPLALAILELVKNRKSPALRLILKRAKVKKLTKIIKAYESAGVRL